MKITIAGTGQTIFGELWKMGLVELMQEACQKAFVDARLEPGDIEAIYVANMGAEQLEGQAHLGAVASSLFTHTPPGVRIEGACASGGLAMLAAIDALRARRYKTVMIVGVEKMTDHSNEVITEMLSGASDRNNEKLSTFPGLYALLANLHSQKYGTNPSQLAAVAVKNHHNAMDNPYAQFHKEVTVEEVLNSPVVASPLNLLDCSPISDGAAAVILTSKCVDKKPQIVGYGHGQDKLALAERTDVTGFRATRRAASMALNMACLNSREINLYELHDCFTIAEIVAYEDLGLTSPGKGGRLAEKLMEKGESHRLKINLSGGLKACGHPIGATGVKQIAYLSQRLVEGEEQYALAQNVGGLGATSVIHILKMGTKS